MNVAFRLTSPQLEQKFIAEATKADFYGLEGHRSIGGLRASLYNAVTEEDVAQLNQFMRDFYKRNRS